MPRLVITLPDPAKLRTQMHISWARTGQSKGLARAASIRISHEGEISVSDALKGEALEPEQWEGWLSLEEGPSLLEALEEMPWNAPTDYPHSQKDFFIEQLQERGLLPEDV